MATPEADAARTPPLFVTSGILSAWRQEFAAETKSPARALAVIVLQLAALGVLVHLLAIENPLFAQRVVPLALVGAVAHHLLPKAYRLSFFGVLSLAAIGVVFGISDGAWLVGVGLALILLCHVPVAFSVRVGLVLLAGGLLAAQRVEVVGAPWSGAIWPILGSMFMFRMVIYLYDLRHAKTPTRWDERIAYFFSLPNVAFPLFPVIDFATFRRTYYDRPSHEIYREGVRWMVRGITHLVLYRAVYQYGTLAAADVESGAQLVQYLVANFGLYLRVSGQFHLIIGLLHLFGFRLPETHRFFYLASSFSDLWRRINIYWKDFVQKIFYMPVFFRLRRVQSETAALVASTVAVFVATWALHSYQWFWILGIWLITATDAAFWALLALCLIVNQLWERRRGRARFIGVPVVRGREVATHAAKTAAMFTTMCLLWALWSAPSFDVFLSMLQRARFGWVDLGVTLAVLGAVAVAAALGFRQAQAPARRTSGRRDIATTAGFAFMLAVVVVGSEDARAFITGPAHTMVANVRDGRLNAQDQLSLRAGYYENLMNVNRFNSELWRLYGGRGALRNRGPIQAGVVQEVDDARVEVVIPNLDTEFKGARLTTNAWGMRDLPYALEKEAGTWRIALFGASYVFGSGVGDGETFESIVEERLNQEIAGRPTAPGRYEILNFAVPGSSPLQYLAMLAHGDVERFAPDVVLVVGNRNEFWNVAGYFTRLRRTGSESPLPEVMPILEAAGLWTGASRDSLDRRLVPARDSILRALYAAIGREARRMGAIPAYGPIEMPLERREGNVSHLVNLAAGEGFVTIDLGDIYRGQKEHTLILHASDRHPNAKGHQLIAHKFFEALDRRPELLGLEPRVRMPESARIQSVASRSAIDSAALPVADR